MLIYLLLWLYLSSTFVFCNSHVLRSSAARLQEPISSSRKYRNPDTESFKKHVVAHNSKSLFDPAMAENKDTMPNVNVAELLSKLRENWEPPSTYLEKRGYLSQKKRKAKNRQQKAHQGSLKADDIKSLRAKLKNLERYKPRQPSDKGRCNLNLVENGALGSSNEQNRFESPIDASGKFKKQSTNTTEPPVAASPATDSPATDSPAVASTAPANLTENTKPTGFLAKVKSKFHNLFHPEKSRPTCGQELTRDILSDEIESFGRQKKKQKFFDFKYDDSWLREPDEVAFDAEDNTLGWCSNALVDMNSTNIASAETSSNSAGSSDDLSSRFGDVLKNLTQADIDYVRNFLKCYKENKEKFIVDYLHANKTSTKSGASSAIAANGTLAKDISTNTVTLAANSTSTSASTSGQGTNASKNSIASDNVQLDINIQANDTGEGRQIRKSLVKREIPAAKSIECGQLQFPKKIKITKLKKKRKKIFTTSKPFDASGCTCPCSGPASAETENTSPASAKCTSPPETDETKNCDPETKNIANLLKFLAHQHHSVYEVGKLPHKPLDLSCVQRMIDDAHETLQSAVTDRGPIETSGNGTQCTPVRLDELNLDFEWSDQPSKHSEPSAAETVLDSSAIEKLDRARNSLISEYLLGNSDNVPKIPLDPPFAENFIVPEDVGVDQLGNLLNSLTDDLVTDGKKKRDVAQPEFSDDSDSGDNWELAAPENEDKPAGLKATFNLDDYLQDYGDESRLRKDLGDEDEYDSYEDYDEASEDSELFGRKKKRKRKKKKKKRKKYGRSEPTDNVPIIPDTGSSFDLELEKTISPARESKSIDPGADEMTNFSEFGDIKFRVNSDQEEDIQKFIDSLNAPPQIFNFDIEKFIKSKGISEESQHIDASPPKTFYEFLVPPDIANERIPYIQMDSASQSQPSDDSIIDAVEETASKNQEKRDILRQYIKGLSEHKQFMYPETMQQSDEKGDNKLQTRSNTLTPIDREEALISNYAHNLDYLNYERFDSHDQNPLDDDFIDKFYLLNDGSIPFSNPDNVDTKKDETIDPVTLDIDLELDRKFKDFAAMDRQAHMIPGKCTGPDCGRTEKEGYNSEPMKEINNFGLMYIPESDVRNPETDGTKEKEGGSENILNENFIFQ